MYATAAVFAGPFLGMGIPELVIILAIALVIFGPKNLPKLGQALGRTVKSVREGLDNKEELPEADGADIEVEEDEVEKKSTKKSSSKK